MIDSRYIIQTPEGIELPVSVAGAPARALAWLLDAIIVALLYLAVSTVISGTIEQMSGSAAIGLLLVLFFIINWSYDIIFEVWLGGTLGKRSMKLKVIHTNGTPVGLKASFIRNVLRSTDLLPFAYALGLVIMCLSQRFQRIGDVLAGTVVIYKEHSLLGTAMTDVPSIAVPPNLTYDDRQTILLFAERYPTLSPQRSAELAQRLAFLVPENKEDPIPTLLGYANWLIRG